MSLAILLWMLANSTIHKPEPMDVPAIHAPAETYMVSVGCEPSATLCSNDAMTCANNGRMVEYGKCVDGWRWTCADKRRILLTGEDGVNHCILFGRGE